MIKSESQQLKAVEFNTNQAQELAKSSLQKKMELQARIKFLDQQMRLHINKKNQADKSQIQQQQYLKRNQNLKVRYINLGMKKYNKFTMQIQNKKIKLIIVQNNRFRKCQKHQEKDQIRLEIQNLFENDLKLSQLNQKNKYIVDSLRQSRQQSAKQNRMNFEYKITEIKNFKQEKTQFQLQLKNKMKFKNQNKKKNKQLKKQDKQVNYHYHQLHNQLKNDFILKSIFKQICNNFKIRVAMDTQDRVQWEIGMKTEKQLNKILIETVILEKQPDDGCITYPTIHGQLKNLPKIQRAHPWVTKDVIVPNDGFKEFRSVTQTQYDRQNIENKQNIKNLNSTVKQNQYKNDYPESNPFKLNVQEHKVEKMLNSTNLHEITRTQRPVIEKRTDYGSTLSRHGPEYNRLYAMTTNQQFYSRQNKPTIEETNNEKQQQQAGIVERDPLQYGLKQTSVLTGEQFRNKQDPKDNVFVQRTWLYQNDKALQQGNQNLEQVSKQSQNPLQTYKQDTNQVFDHDIGTSLPLKNGVDNLRQKYPNNNEHRHIRTDVTIIHNKLLRQ